MQEFVPEKKILYQRGDSILVTDKLFKRFGKTWLIAHITNVMVEERPVNLTGLLVNCGILLMSLFVVAGPMYVLALTMVAIAAFNLVNILQKRYVIRVQFVSGEEEKIVTSDQGFATRLSNALHRAMRAEGLERSKQDF